MSIKMETKPKGGRGHKAPYKTKIMRVPEPIAYRLEELCDIYRQASLQGNWDGIDGDLLVSTTPLDRLDKNQAMEEAKKILKQKKSARVSLEKLLQVLYGNDEIKL